MKTLITGHRGFVGTEFWKTLSDRGHDLTGIDIVEGNDARDFFRNDDTQFDLVIHLAAVVGGREKIDGEPLSVAVDLSIDSEMFGWALRTRPKQIVYYSSSAAYPIALQTEVSHEHLAEHHIRLDTIQSPDMTYGWSKLTGEYLTKFARQEGLNVNVFRPFSGYGETQSLDYPFPSFIDRAKRHDDPFFVWGDGTAQRDFIHIDDVVQATLEITEQEQNITVNLGTGVGTSFNKLASMAMSEAGYKGEIAHLTERPVGVHYRVANANQMRRYYEPKITLEEGIRRALNA